MVQEFGSDWTSIKLLDLISFISLKTQIPKDGIKLLTSGGKSWNYYFNFWESKALEGSFGLFS